MLVFGLDAALILNIGPGQNVGIETDHGFSADLHFGRSIRTASGDSGGVKKGVPLMLASIRPIITGDFID